MAAAKVNVLNDEPGDRPTLESATSTIAPLGVDTSPTTARTAPVAGSTEATTAWVSGLAAFSGLVRAAASASSWARGS